MLLGKVLGKGTGILSSRVCIFIVRTHITLEDTAHQLYMQAASRV